MDIEKRLTEEHSKNLTISIVEFVGHDRKRFKGLMNLFLKGDYQITQRAAWPLSYVCIAQPKLVAPYFPKLLDKLVQPGNHPAIKRNILRIFENIEIPEKYQGALIDICFKIIPDPVQPIAVVAFAISTVTKLCKPFPELKRELLLVLNQLSAYPQKPAITGRIKRAIKDLTKLQIQFNLLSSDGKIKSGCVNFQIELLKLTDNNCFHQPGSAPGIRRGSSFQAMPLIFIA